MDILKKISTLIAELRGALKILGYFDRRDQDFSVRVTGVPFDVEVVMPVEALRDQLFQRVRDLYQTTCEAGAKLPDLGVLIEQAKAGEFDR